MDQDTETVGHHSGYAVASMQAGDGIERIRFRALGGPCEIQFVAPQAKAGRAFVSAVTSWLQAFEARYSRFRLDSLIGRINAAAGRDWITLDADAERMFALADKVFVLTRGILDPSALPLIRLWNYHGNPPRVPTFEEITEALARIGWARVRREPGRVYLPEEGMGLDFGCFAKEFAVDRVAEMARAHGIFQVVVDFGNNMRVVGKPPGAEAWLVGVEDASHPGSIARRLQLSTGGVATAGDFCRYFESGGRRFGHIIDARVGHPANSGCTSVTVVAGSCLEAGLLATTAYVLGPAEGLQMIEGFFGAEGCVGTADGERQTGGFKRYLG